MNPATGRRCQIYLCLTGIRRSRFDVGLVSECRSQHKLLPQPYIRPSDTSDASSTSGRPRRPWSLPSRRQTPHVYRLAQARTSPAPRTHTLGFSGGASHAPAFGRIKVSHPKWGMPADNLCCCCIPRIGQVRSSPWPIFGTFGRASLRSRPGGGCNKTGVIRGQASEPPSPCVTCTRPASGDCPSPFAASAFRYAKVWHPCHVAAGLRPPRRAVRLHAVSGRFAAARQACGHPVRLYRRRGGLQSPPESDKSFALRSLDCDAIRSYNTIAAWIRPCGCLVAPCPAVRIGITDRTLSFLPLRSSEQCFTKERSWPGRAVPSAA